MPIRDEMEMKCFTQKVHMSLLELNFARSYHVIMSRILSTRVHGQPKVARARRSSLSLSLRVAKTS